MDSRSRVLTVRLRSILLLVAIFAALTLLYLHTNVATYAQTESSQTLAAPALTAAATGATTVELSWNAVTDAVTYELWTWDSVTGWQLLYDGNLADTVHTHDELSPGSTYY